VDLGVLDERHVRLWVTPRKCHEYVSDRQGMRDDEDDALRPLGDPPKPGRVPSNQRLSRLAAAGRLGRRVVRVCPLEVGVQRAAFVAAVQRVSPWRPRSARSIRVGLLDGDVRRDEQVATGLKNGPVREADTVGDPRDTEVADGVYAGAHDGRRDRDDEAVNELLALRSPTSPAASSCMGH
jgi:hypothetical protein